MYSAFQLLSIAHLSMLALIPVGFLVLCGLRNQPKLVSVARGFLLVLLFTSKGFETYAFLSEYGFSWKKSLPFQPCDLTWCFVLIAVWKPRRWAQALSYYWGLGAAYFAMLSPDLRFDFPHWHFISLMSTHVAIVWACFYILLIQRFTPTLRNLKNSVLVFGGWGILMTFLNSWIGSNYFFTYVKPAGTFLDFLGPWPFYPIAVLALSAFYWLLMTLPWVKVRP